MNRNPAVIQCRNNMGYGLSSTALGTRQENHSAIRFGQDPLPPHNPAGSKRGGEIQPTQQAILTRAKRDLSPR